MEGDYLLAIEAFRKFPLREDLRVYGRISDIFLSVAAFESCVFSLVIRGANDDAHHLLVGLSLRLNLDAILLFMSIFGTLFGSMRISLVVFLGLF